MNAEKPARHEVEWYLALVVLAVVVSYTSKATKGPGSIDAAQATSGDAISIAGDVANSEVYEGIITEWRA